MLFVEIMLNLVMVDKMKASNHHYDEVDVEDAVRRGFLDMAWDLIIITIKMKN